MSPKDIPVEFVEIKFSYFLPRRTLISLHRFRPPVLARILLHHRPSHIRLRHDRFSGSRSRTRAWVDGDRTKDRSRSKTKHNFSRSHDIRVGPKHNGVFVYTYYARPVKCPKTSDWGEGGEVQKRRQQRAAVCGCGFYIDFISCITITGYVL